MPTSAADMVTVLQTFLATKAGVKEVTVDGQLIVLDRAQAIRELDYWTSQAAKEAGTRKLFRGINLGTGF